MLFWQQLERIQVEFVGRFAVGMHNFAIDDELNFGDLGLPAGINRNHLGFGNVSLRRWRKVIRYRRRQGGDLKFGAQPAHIAFDIGNSNIKLMLARLFLDRLNREGLVRRDHLAIKRDFNAFDILIGVDLDRDLRIFRQRLGEEIIGQEEQGHGNRRAQRRVVRRALAIGCVDVQREIITRAISRHLGARADDILAAEELGQVAVDIAQFLRQRRIVKLGVGFSRDRFEEALVDVPAQAD